MTRGRAQAGDAELRGPGVTRARAQAGYDAAWRVRGGGTGASGASPSGAGRGEGAVPGA
ncbi:hypothetical protein SAM23877_2526 [Streptomyces ambofaciens ATCC 23877]|uniref:Uncharacterized protein n=1 Tax=Streptomyces ambofaciens (strain ATCC 23877 / 3486 / DSM 40053 / JCM 4204 / NBRC 12836 / NRRL B-2516) TaxID=278992 RepID=A0A0K2AR44_STRA7|nr:hypothetical protein SAM23877_2526 [Streptomyces ambofaciens ATCC 23877]